jgi:serine/threonine protein kinase
VRFIVRQLVETIESFHEAGIMHLDLKPANIFISEGMRVKVGDFGVATTIGSNSK